MYSSISRRGTTKEDLRQICKENWTPPRNCYDEVYPGIILGDGTTALSVRTLSREGVRYIINSAMSCDECLRKDHCGTCVQTKASYYTHSDIKYKGIQAHDEKRFPLYKYFEECAQFIHEALTNGYGKVYVHCQQGISRSATLIIAYLMMKRGMSAQDATRIVRRKRPIFPNDGFLEQLCDLELRLRSHRIYA